jgi:NAD(P)H-dependent flavin oxidoreductase YrpB (nitropropane dioxygenase family)
VNLVLPSLQGDEISTCLDERVAVLVLFWGDPAPYVAEAHAHGTQVIMQVGSVGEARAAAAAGVDAVMVQGVEAGGHVRGTTALSVLVPAVHAAIHPTPIVAAGGIADGRGLVAALALGAEAVSMGTRFLASDEAAASRAYKERIVAASAEDTVLSTLFDIGWPDAPHRALRNRVVAEWEAAGRPASGRRPGEGTLIGRTEIAGMTIDVPRYSVVPPLPAFDGDIDEAVLYAGESCSLIRDIRPAAAIVRDIVAEAEAIRAGFGR